MAGGVKYSRVVSLITMDVLSLTHCRGRAGADVVGEVEELLRYLPPSSGAPDCSGPTGSFSCTRLPQGMQAAVTDLTFDL